MFSKAMKGPMKYIWGVIALAILVTAIAIPVAAALPDTIYLVDGTPIIVADCAGDYAGDLGSCTDQLSLAGVGGGEARQSDKLDFGADRAEIWVLHSSIEFAAAPTTGSGVAYFIGYSLCPTAGTGNSGGTSGVDSAYTGTEDDNLSNSLKQLERLGSVFATSDAAGSSADAIQFVGARGFTTVARYGNLVVVNNTGVAFNSDDIEMGVSLAPLLTQIQE